MAGINEQCWGKSGKCWAGGKKSVRRSKVPLFSPSSKLPSLARGFPGLHRHLEQHPQPFPWAPSVTGPRRSSLAQSPFWICPHHLQPHWRGTASSMLLALNLPFFSFSGSSSAEKYHLTSILRGFCSWISCGFDLWASRPVPLGPLVEKVVGLVFSCLAKATESTAQLNTAILFKHRKRLNTQQHQIISYRVFPSDVFICKWGMLHRFCLSNYRLAASTAGSQLFHYLLCFIYKNTFLKMISGEG